MTVREFLCSNSRFSWQEPELFSRPYTSCYCHEQMPCDITTVVQNGQFTKDAENLMEREIQSWEISFDPQDFDAVQFWIVLKPET